NIALALAEKGLRVVQIGCDPKADSTSLLLRGDRAVPVLDLVRRGVPFDVAEQGRTGAGGVICVESGGPAPGVGCAGRGIITALETLESRGAFKLWNPDVVLYDVLGDVVCGGFSMPMRKGYADCVFILTSGEKMALYAAANIAMAVEHFRDRDYARLGGFILNSRNVKDEEPRVRELAADFGSAVVGTLPWSPLVQEAEEKKQVLPAAFPRSEMAECYRRLARAVLAAAGKEGRP
ncbi:MAG: nitrogenase iron protein, partial [Lentisphaeria bacterium]|nr:nitrogenase iron protein [Lentisphaeria bacterium]